MATVKEELEEIHEDVEGILSSADTQEYLSSEVRDELYSLRSQITNSLQALQAIGKTQIDATKEMGTDVAGAILFTGLLNFFSSLIGTAVSVATIQDSTVQIRKELKAIKRAIRQRKAAHSQYLEETTQATPPAPEKKQD